MELLSLKLQDCLKFDHLYALTDHNAVLQHAKYSIPAKREGYTVDDNARALVFAVRAQILWPSKQLSELQRTLLAFLLLMQDPSGRMHNLMDFSQKMTDKPSVGDHLGRSIWAAGTVMNSTLPAGMKNSARHIFDLALPHSIESTSPRTKAYTILGMAERIQSDPKDQNLATNLKDLAHSLLELYNQNNGPDWEWFEGNLTYDNARLSQAMLATYVSLGDTTYLDVAQKSLRFLIKNTTISETFVPIGSNGWYPRGGKRALYDQQPIEAGGMIETAALAHNITNSRDYEKPIRQALAWFFGVNTNSAVVYDAATGACCDGVNQRGLNENQGSESTIAFLLAATTFIQTYAKAPYSLHR